MKYVHIDPIEELHIAESPDLNFQLRTVKFGHMLALIGSLIYMRNFNFSISDRIVTNFRIQPNQQPCQKLSTR